MHSHKDELLLTRLNHHPQLRERIETLLNIVDNVAGDCAKADAAEQAVIEELRKLGTAALQEWAEQAVHQAVETVRAQQPAQQGNGEKSLVAHAVRNNYRQRAALAWAWRTGAPLSVGSRDSRAALFAAVATRADRLWCGPCVWASAGEVAGTLWDYAGSEYGAQAYRASWRAHAGATGTRAGAGQ